MNEEEITIEEVYGISKKEVPLERITVPSGKVLERFESPVKSPPMAIGNTILPIFEDNRYIVEIDIPEFTCLCPRTSHPDFALITLRYMPGEWCVELKSLKYYFNSFRNEGHFHEQVCNLIYDDIHYAISPDQMQIVGKFNVRGGTYPTIIVGKLGWDESDPVAMMKSE